MKRHIPKFFEEMIRDIIVKSPYHNYKRTIIGDISDKRLKSYVKKIVKDSYYISESPKRFLFYKPKIKLEDLIFCISEEPVKTIEYNKYGPIRSFKTLNVRLFDPRIKHIIESTINNTGDYFPKIEFIKTHRWENTKEYYENIIFPAIERILP